MLGFRRLFSSAASAASAAGAATGAVSPASAVRHTLKPLASRKTYLVDLYTHLLRSNSVVLAVHNSTLLLPEDRALRSDLAKVGAKLTIVRSSLMRVALRGLDEPDPAALSRREGKPHPLTPVFKGPAAVITLSELDPAAVDKVIDIIDKSQNRLILLAGIVNGIDGAVFRGDLDILRKLPTLPQLHAQLAGVLTLLGGAGLTQTLEATQQSLVLSLEQHAKRDCT